MANAHSIQFAAAHKALMKAADADPVWFYIAADVHKASDDGSKLLLHALMDGLRAAYEAGRAGKPPPPLKYVQSIALDKKGSWREPENGDEPAPASPRVRRAPPAAPAPVQARPRRRAST